MFQVSDYGKARNLFRILFDVNSETEAVELTMYSFKNRIETKLIFNIDELDAESENEYKEERKALNAYFEMY